LGAIIATKGTGTVTNFSAGDLSPLFTTSEATTTTTPALSFSLSNAGAYTVFGNQTNASAAPSFAKLNINSIDATGTPSATTYLRGDGSWATAGGSSGVNYISADSAFVGAVSGPGANGSDGGSGFPQNKNILIGPSSGINMTTGRVNVALGNGALRWNSTGTGNIAIGDSTLFNLNANTGNSNNVAIGRGALYSYTGYTATGTASFAFGYNAAYSMQNGIVTAIGERALELATGNANTSVGSASLQNIGAGANNTAVGYQAGFRFNAGASQNTVIGMQAVGSGSGAAGMDNAIFGYQAQFTGAGGSYNTSIGAGAAYGLTTGSYNTILGMYAGQNTAITSTGSLIIGAYQSPLSASANYQLVIGGSNSGNSRWLISDLSSTHRRWTINGTSSDVSANTAGVTLDITGTLGGVRFPSVTTAQRNSITAATNNQVTNSELDIDNDYNGTVWTVNDGTIFTQTADATVASTVTETTILGTGSGTLTIPASYLYSGNTIVIKVWGYMTTNGTPTLDIKFKLGSTTIASTGATTLVSVATNGYFEAEAVLTPRASPGAAAAIMGQGKFTYFSSATTPNMISAMNTATVNAATNGSLAVNVTATWGTSDAANKIVSTNAVVEIKN
jgi:hypothetical protein